MRVHAIPAYLRSYSHLAHRFYFPLIAGLSIPLAIFSPPSGEYNPADWFKCTTEHVFEWDQLDDEWYVILSRVFLLYVPALWCTTLL